MPISYAKLKALLDVDEPDYAALAEKAEDVVRHLRKLAASPDVSLASKAVSLAGIIGDDGCIGIVGRASKSRNVIVRVAAAHASTLLPDSPQSARVVNKLLDDKDVGVVKFATRAAARQSDPDVAAKAKRARTRMVATVRATTAQQAQRERSAAMAMKKASKKARGTAKTTRKGRTKAAAGRMPTGAMTEPKGPKARKMPTGKMR